MEGITTTPEPEPDNGYVKTTQPFLHSTYKCVSECNYTDTSKASVFRVRQFLKSHQFNRVNAIGVALKLSIFVTTLSLLV